MMGVTKGNLMKNNGNSIFSIVIILVLIAGVYFIVQTVRETAAAAAAPFQQAQRANEELQTQVAQLLNPTPTIIPDPVTYINEVRALARLETIQYSVEKVITAEVGEGPFGFLFRDKLLLVAHGVVIAGIDMSKIQPEDMRLDNGLLTVKLPPAEIFIATLDNQKSYVYQRDTGLLTKGVDNLETLARQSAEEEIRKAALEDGILEQAQTNAEAYLQKFFMALGYKTVIFTH
jgi:cbb3-type cytochrome oxidase subunit 3